MKTVTMRLVEHQFGQTLEELLTQWTEEDLSPVDMAEQIRKRGVTVTPEAVRQWIKRLGGQRTMRFPEAQEAAVR